MSKPPLITVDRTVAVQIEDLVSALREAGWDIPMCAMMKRTDNVCELVFEWADSEPARVTKERQG